jgi:hypothetical protein
MPGNDPLPENDARAARSVLRAIRCSVEHAGNLSDGDGVQVGAEVARHLSDFPGATVLLAGGMSRPSAFSSKSGSDGVRRRDGKRLRTLAGKTSGVRTAALIVHNPFDLVMAAEGSTFIDAVRRLTPLLSG